MQQLSVFLEGQVSVHGAFISRQAAVVAKDGVMAAKRDDPMGVHEFTDDFSNLISFCPGQVIASVIVDKGRESELIIQNHIRTMEGEVEKQQRVNGNAKIQAGFKMAQMYNQASRNPHQ